VNATPHPACPPTVAEIAELTTWCRRLTQTRPANQHELAAYLAAKADLLARIHTTDPTTTHQRKDQQ
jgi:hypothetical protein